MAVHTVVSNTQMRVLANQRARAGATIGKRLEWKAHVVDIVSWSKQKHRQVQPLAASPHVDPAVVEQYHLLCVATKPPTGP